MTTYKKHNLLKFEHMLLNTVYCITLNPEDDGQCFGNIQRINDFMEKHKKALNVIIKDTCHLELMLEISPSGRLHFHGYITLFDKISFYSDIIHNLMKKYMIEIDIINDPCVWNNYIVKQCELHTYCLKNNIPMPLKVGTDFKKLTKDFFSAKPH